MKLWPMLYVPLILLLSIACEKEDTPSEFEQSWYKCRQENQLDEPATFVRLMGEWKLIAAGCGNCLSLGLKATDKDIRLIFTSDSMLQVLEEGQVIRNSKFIIRGADNNAKQLETVPLLDNLYTWGVIEFCEDKVVFNSSYSDGPLYYFQRINP